MWSAAWRFGLFTATVFLRNAFRAYQTSKPFLEKGVLVRSFVLAAIFSAVVPSVINLEINKIVSEMKNGDAAVIRKNTQILIYVSPIVNLDTITLRYHRATPIQGETEEMKAIAEAYKQLKGEDIETKSRVLMD